MTNMRQLVFLANRHQRCDVMPPCWCASQERKSPARIRAQRKGGTATFSHHPKSLSASSMHRIGQCRLQCSAVERLYVSLRGPQGVWLCGLNIPAPPRNATNERLARCYPLSVKGQGLHSGDSWDVVKNRETFRHYLLRVVIPSRHD
jgi:hypothetical protein